MGAIISACSLYRYALTRNALTPGKVKPPLGWCMLNPSTADAELDDPTITKCRKYAEREGFNGILVVNVYALRATDPANLWTAPDPVGPANAKALAKAASCVSDMVVGWGTEAEPAQAARAVTALYSGNRNLRLWCLGVNKAGSPKHPLYIKDSQELWPYPPAFWHHAESECVFVGSHADHAEVNSMLQNGCDSVDQETYLRFKQQYDG